MANSGAISIPAAGGNHLQRAQLHVLFATLLVSLIFHALLLAAISRFPLRRLPPSQRQIVVSVEIVLVPDTTGKARAIPPHDPVTTSLGPTPGPIKPRTMLANSVLADPRSAEALALLPQLAAAERAEQLCNVEAMAQIAAWNDRFKPDLVIAYARSETATADNMVVADGAAFHGAGGWYRLSYKCRPDVETSAVKAFEFSIGATIARNEWETLGLPADGGVKDHGDRHESVSPF